MPLFRGTRPLKRWRYVGVFCEELMLCTATVQVGPARQSFWALLTREDACLRERTHTLLHRSAIELDPGRPREPGRAGRPGRLLVCDGPVRIDLALEEDAGWEATCPHGAQSVWTRKQAGIRAHGTVVLDTTADLDTRSDGEAPPDRGAPRTIEALAIVDDTAGYHARVTEWRWAAGVGVDPAGRPLAFNLVHGVNDPPTGSERAVWVDGVPHETPPVSIAADLSRIVGEDGSQLRFAAEATRARHENLLLVRSDYRAPFGTFNGTLPGGIELADGLGVVEHHRARW
jgi:hypothetical protein